MPIGQTEEKERTFIFSSQTVHRFMKFTLITTALMLGVFAITPASQAAGPLDPSAGPGSPATQMPSLVEIKAAIDALATSSLNGRTPIPGTSGAAAAGPAFTISAPGSYVLTGNIAVTSGDAIRITASSVTLDLNGFTISSNSSGLSGAAINIDPGATSLTDVHVKNGHVRGNTVYTSSWLDGGFEWGVKAAPSTTSAISLSELRITRCGSGIAIPSAKVDRCAVESIHHYGIQANDVTNSVVERCGETGILASKVSDCTADTLGTDLVSIHAGIQANNVARCTATAKGQAYGINGGVVTQCSATSTSSTWAAINGKVVSYCLGSSPSAVNAIVADTSAIGCVAAQGISSPSKHLGTP